MTRAATRDRQRGAALKASQVSPSTTTEPRKLGRPVGSGKPMTLDWQTGKHLQQVWIGRAL